MANQELTGGSLRIPAACTGIFTLRPSFGRFPTLGCRSGMGGQEAVQSVNGPMTRTITDLELYSKTVVNRQTWQYDPRCVPIAWRDVELPSKLKIAVMWNDGMVRPTPPVARALCETVEKLKTAGHEIVEWDPKDQKEGLSLLDRMFVADGGISIKKELDKTEEPWRPEMAAYSKAKELGTYDMWQLHLQRTAFQKRYLDRWVAAGIDAILCPTTPFTSVKNGTFKHGEFFPLTISEKKVLTMMQWDIPVSTTCWIILACLSLLACLRIRVWTHPAQETRRWDRSAKQFMPNVSTIKTESHL